MEVARGMEVTLNISAIHMNRSYPLCHPPLAKYILLTLAFSHILGRRRARVQTRAIHRRSEHGIRVAARCLYVVVAPIDSRAEPISGIPFTVGPRVCLGQRFALLESTCILARVLRRCVTVSKLLLAVVSVLNITPLRSYRYCITPTPSIARLSRDEQWKVLTKWTRGMTSIPGQVELMFHARAE